MLIHARSPPNNRVENLNSKGSPCQSMTLLSIQDDEPAQGLHSLRPINARRHCAEAADTPGQFGSEGINKPEFSPTIACRMSVNQPRQHVTSVSHLDPNSNVALDLAREANESNISTTEMSVHGEQR